MQGRGRLNRVTGVGRLDEWRANSIGTGWRRRMKSQLKFAHSVACALYVGVRDGARSNRQHGRRWWSGFLALSGDPSDPRRGPGEQVFANPIWAVLRSHRQRRSAVACRRAPTAGTLRDVELTCQRGRSRGRGASTAHALVRRGEAGQLRHEARRLMPCGGARRLSAVPDARRQVGRGT